MSHFRIKYCFAMSRCQRSIAAIFTGLILLSVFSFYLRSYHYKFPYQKSLDNVHVMKQMSCKPKPVTSKWDKWVVTTTIQSPTAEMKTLNSLPGWKLVVIGDTKTPSDWKLEGAVYLDVEAQEKLCYNSVPMIPFKSYTRKNIGYLYAIEHGAKYIYETDDDNMMQSLAIFHFDGDFHGLLINTNEVAINPYAHFGQATMWPRGYPLEHMGKILPRTYVFGPMKVPAVQQGVVNGDPDVDALFRITRKPADFDVNVTFDGGAPAVVLPRDTYSPYNSQNTLFKYNALWSLLLPVSVTDRETDIFRAYWAQKLLSLIGEKLSFVPPRTVQKRNQWHKHLKDAQDELKIYFKIGKLCTYLRQWKCNAPTFFKCVIKLTSDMIDQEYYKSIDLELVTAWIKDIQAFGYEEPKMVSMSNDYKDTQAVIYRAWEQTTCMLHSKELSLPVNTTDNMLFTNIVFKTCGSDQAIEYKRNIVEPRIKYSDSVLVVTITTTMDSIMYIETLFKLYFPRIVYCGKNEISGDLNNLKHMSYIQLKEHSPLSCLEAAMKMQYNVKQYMQVTDTVALSPALLSALGSTSALPTAVVSTPSHTPCTDCITIDTATVQKLNIKLQTIFNIKNNNKYDECMKQFVNPQNVNQYIFSPSQMIFVVSKKMEMSLLRGIQTCKKEFKDICVGCYHTINCMFNPDTIKPKMEFNFSYNKLYSGDKSLQPAFCKMLAAVNKGTN